MMLSNLNLALTAVRRVGAGAAADTTPDAFSFTDVTDAFQAWEYVSNTITVAGMDIGETVAVTISGGTYSKNGGAYTSSAGTATNGDTFAVKVTSASSTSSAVTSTLTIGGVSDTYSVTTSATAPFDADMPTFDATNAAMAGARAGMLRVKNGTGRCRALFIGDSVTIGVGGGSSPTAISNAREHNPVHHAAEYLETNYSIQTTNDAIMGVVAGAGGGLLQNATSLTDYFNAKHSYGSGWSWSTVSVGGLMVSNNASSTAISWEPLKPINTVEVLWRRSSGLGTFSVDFAGSASASQSQSGAAAFFSRTFTSGSSAATQIINVNRVSGFAIAGSHMIAYDSAVPAIDMINAGWSGSKIGNWTGNTNPYDPRPTITLLDPDIIVINLQINDTNSVTGTSQSTYFSSLRTLVLHCLGTGASVILCTAHQCNTSLNTLVNQQAYANQVKAVANDASVLAANNGLPVAVFDNFTKWGAYDAGRMSDDVHPTDGLYVPQGQWYASAFNELYQAA